MAAYDASGDLSKPVHRGPGLVAPVMVESELQQALANTDTIGVKAPTGYEDWVPINVTCFSNASPRVRQANIAITNHNTSTGVTTLTASGAVADSSTILVEYAPCTLGT